MWRCLVTDLIRKAVSLADGWRETVLPFIDQRKLDALAAQLVRQVDATDDYYVIVKHDFAAVRGRGPCVKHVEDDDADRTLNTINAIVESGVLELKENDGE
jgi:hypothetical protein